MPGERRSRSARRLLPGQMLRMLAALLLLPAVLLAAQRHVPSPAAVELNGAGVVDMNRHQFKEAAASFRKALDEDKDFDLARVNLGIALLYDMAPGGALPIFREALARDERNVAAHFCLGLVLKGAGESEEAIAHFRRVVDLDPGCASAQYNLGVLLARRRQTAPAERAFRECLALDPDHAPALYNLGLLLNQSGRAAEGKILLDRSQSLRAKTEPASGMGRPGMEYGAAGKYAVARDYR